MLGSIARLMPRRKAFTSKIRPNSVLPQIQEAAMSMRNHRCHYSANGNAPMTSAMGTSPVPIINMSLSEEELGDAIHQACTTDGFFIIVNHGVSEDLCSKMLQQARLLFSELSPDDKEAISVKHSDSYRGFQTMGVNITNGKLDGHEALDLVSESTRAVAPRRVDDSNKMQQSLTNYGKNQWPNPAILPEFRHTTEVYIDEMQTVGQRLMKACSRGLGLDPTFFEPYFDDAYWSMRMIRYPIERDEGEDDFDFGVGKSEKEHFFTLGV